MRIGVYVCECGINISATVDVERVAQAAKDSPNVKVSRFYKYMCSDPGQEMIKQDIKEHDLDRIVVASCSPLMHEPTFRAAVEEAGMNKYCFEMANIREQCSWVHKDIEAGTQKAISITRGAIAKAALLQALDEKEVPVTKKALVMGGGISGIQTALDIADMGVPVTLVETTPSIGGHMAQLDKTFPTMDCSACILTPKMVDAAHHPNIELLSYAEVEEVEGFVGNFKVKVRQKARSVDMEKCTGCGDCVENCPLLLIPQYQVRPERAPPVRDQEYVDGLLAQYVDDGGALIQIMLEVNEHYRYLPRDILEYLSFRLEVPFTSIYRIATFYKSFSLVPKGVFHIKTCLGTACHVRGARQLVDTVRNKIADAQEGLFSIERVNCVGACAIGPAIVVNDDVHGHMTPNKVSDLLNSLEAEHLAEQVEAETEGGD